MQSRFANLIPTRDREHRPRKMSRAQRMLHRTNGRCAYCSCEITQQTMTRDHIVPRARGGVTCDDNLIACCQPCNQRKGDLDVEEFRALYFEGGVFWFEILEGAG